MSAADVEHDASVEELPERFLELHMVLPTDVHGGEKPTRISVELRCDDGPAHVDQVRADVSPSVIRAASSVEVESGFKVDHQACAANFNDVLSGYVFSRDRFGHFHLIPHSSVRRTAEGSGAAGAQPPAAPCGGAR